MMREDSPAWIMYTQIAFFVSLAMMAIGIFFLPVDFWMRGYLGMATVFIIGSTITMTKTVRDNHESKKLVNRIDDAKTEKLLKGFEGETV